MILGQFREDLSVVFQRDPAARNYFEILTTYPGVHALILHRLAHFLWSIKLNSYFLKSNIFIINFNFYIIQLIKH